MGTILANTTYCYYLLLLLVATCCYYCCKYSRVLLQVSWNVVLWLSYEQLKLAVLRHCNNNNNNNK